jgi:hypothetical protein
MLPTTKAENDSGILVAARPRKRCKFSLRIFAAAKDRAAVNQEAGDFPSRNSLLFFVAAEKLSSLRGGG